MEKKDFKLGYLNGGDYVVDGVVFESYVLIPNMDKPIVEAEQEAE